MKFQDLAPSAKDTARADFINTMEEWHWAADVVDDIDAIALALGFHVNNRDIKYDIDKNTAGFNSDFFLFEGIEAEYKISKVQGLCSMRLTRDDWDILKDYATRISKECNRAFGINKAMTDSFGLTCSISYAGKAHYLQHPSVRCVQNSARVRKDFYDNAFDLKDESMDPEIKQHIIGVCNSLDAVAIQVADDLCQWFLSKLHDSWAQATSDKALIESDLDYDECGSLET